jgi:histidinol-phosphatase
MGDDLLLARRAALVGAAVALRNFAAFADLRQELKSDRTVVTAADHAVEAAIRAVLVEGGRPGDAILGEESGQTGGGSRRWIIDPIDGTALFVAGDDRWLVLIALEEAGEVVVGVAAVPAQGKIWWAQRGVGAFEGDMRGPGPSGQRISVDRERPDTLFESRLGVLPSPEAISAEERGLIAPLAAVASPVPWSRHPALLVATGEMDLAIQTRGQVWDYAATSLIVTEAGGRFSGLSGQPLPSSGPAVFARSAALHADALQILRVGRAG